MPYELFQHPSRSASLQRLSRRGLVRVLGWFAIPNGNTGHQSGAGRIDGNDFDVHVVAHPFFCIGLCIGDHSAVTSCREKSTQHRLESPELYGRLLPRRKLSDVGHGMLV